MDPSTLLLLPHIVIVVYTSPSLPTLLTVERGPCRRRRNQGRIVQSETTPRPKRGREGRDGAGRHQLTQ